MEIVIFIVVALFIVNMLLKLSKNIKKNNEVSNEPMPDKPKLISENYNDLPPNKPKPSKIRIIKG